MTSEKDPQAADDAGARSWSYRLARVRPEERGPACLAAAAFFFLFASYAILRPLRDAAGTEGGVGDLKYLWTGTLVATLVLTPIFGWMVARFPRRVFVPAALHFFAANMLVFQMGFAWAGPELEVHVARVFIDDCIVKLREGRLDTVDASMAKWWLTDLQSKVTDECLQLFGGYGYMKEYPISQLYVDARVQRIYGGANEVLKEIIARSL